MNTAYMKQVKKSKKFTLEQISKISCIPKRTVDDIFSGKTENPRIDTVQAIEEALGIKEKYDWTDEEKAAGVGRRAIYLSDDEFDWLELRSEVLRTKGEEYLKTLITMIEAVTKS